MEILTKLNLKCTKIGTRSGDVLLPDVENADNPVKIAAVKDIPVKVYDGNSYYLNGCLENGDGTEFGCLNVGGLGVHGCLNVDGSLCVSGVVSAESITAGSANFTCDKAVEFCSPPKYTGSYTDAETGACAFGSDNFITKCYVDELNTSVQASLAKKANSSDVYTKTAVDTKLAEKANTATTLSGYGIDDAYTKTEVDTALTTKANKATTLSGYGIGDAYTKTEIDGCLATKANASDVYTSETVDTLLKAKAAANHTHAISAVEGLDAKLTCLSGCKVETSTLNSHTGTKATTTTFGHVRLATGLTDAGDHAVPRAQVVKDYLTNNYYTQSDTISCICVMIDSHNTWCTAHCNLFSQKADVCHTHAISDVTNLQSTLNGKASSSHTHAIESVSGLRGVLDNKVSKNEDKVGIGANVSVGNCSVSIGQSSSTVQYGTSVGSYTSASGENSTAIGIGATAGADDSMALGRSSIATHANSIVLNSTNVEKESATANSFNVFTGGGYTNFYVDGESLGSKLEDKLSLSYTAGCQTIKSPLIVCGVLCASGGICGYVKTDDLPDVSNYLEKTCTQIGYSATAYSGSSIAIGCNAVANSHFGISIGTCSYTERNNIAIGQGSNSLGEGDATSIGHGAYSSGCGSLAIGCNANARGLNAIAVGSCSESLSNTSISIGFCSTVFTGAENSISIGRNVRSSGVGNISIGQDLYSRGCLAIAIGLSAGSHGCSSIAIGNKTGAYQAYSIAIGDSSSASCANSIVLSSAPGGDSNGTRTFNVYTGGTGTCTDSAACTTCGMSAYDTFYYNGHSLGCVLKSEIPYCSKYSISSSSASTLSDGRKYIDVTIANLGTQNSNICTTSAYIEVPVNASVYATTGSGTSYSGSYIYPEITWSGTAASKASCVRLIFDEEMLTENSTVAVKVSGIRNS